MTLALWTEMAAATMEESRKRKASEENGFKNGKRPRLVEPAPIVLDEFETEAKREIEANAGLTGAEVTVGQKISLSHQVSHRFHSDMCCR